MTVVDPVAGADRILERLRPVVEAFGAAGFRFALVGGVVRDLALGRNDDVHDVDVTTDARPDDIKRLVGPLADAVWTQGERFGTIGLHIGDDAVEITTHRAEVYDETSRKPVVSFGDDLGDDLARRDFTVNAMAVDGHTRTLVDPYGGLADLAARRLRTPLSPEISFDDDPLRMLRAARFLARFDLTAEPDLVAAMTTMAARLDIVSAERIRDELDKLLSLDHPGPGLDLLAGTGLATRVERSWTVVAMADPAVRTATPPARVERLDLRRAALVGHSDDPGVALRRLKWPGDDIRRTERALVLADEVLAAGPTPSDRMIRSALRGPGPGVVELALDLVEAGHGEEAAAPFADRLAVLTAAEELVAPVPPLDGREVMDRFGLVGPDVGAALAVLEEHRLDHGPIDHPTAIGLLEAWVAARSDPPGDER